MNVVSGRSSSVRGAGRALALLATGVLLAGCGAAATPKSTEPAITIAPKAAKTATAGGLVSGVLQEVGGPLVVRAGKAGTPHPRPLAGVVRLTSVAVGNSYRTSTAASGVFEIRVPVGRYRVTGDPGGSRFWCQGAEVTVGAGRPQRVEVDCPVV
jgi:hypothetical protein